MKLGRILRTLTLAHIDVSDLGPDGNPLVDHDDRPIYRVTIEVDEMPGERLRGYLAYNPLSLPVHAQSPEAGRMIWRVGGRYDLELEERDHAGQKRWRFWVARKPMTLTQEVHALRDELTRLTITNEGMREHMVNMTSAIDTLTKKVTNGGH